MLFKRPDRYCGHKYDTKRPEKHAATNTYSKQGSLDFDNIWSLNHRYVLYCA